MTEVELPLHWSAGHPLTSVWDGHDDLTMVCRGGCWEYEDPDFGPVQDLEIEDIFLKTAEGQVIELDYVQFKVAYELAVRANVARLFMSRQSPLLKGEKHVF